MMKRRAFLKRAALAPVVAPVAVKAAAEQTMNDLSLSAIGGVANAKGSVPEGPRDNIGWFKDRLKVFLGKSAAEIANDRRMFATYSLEAGVSSLQSVSLERKIEMSKNIQFERSRKEEHRHLLNGIAGMFN